MKSKILTILKDLLYSATACKIYSIFTLFSKQDIVWVQKLKTGIYCQYSIYSEEKSFQKDGFMSQSSSEKLGLFDQKIWSTTGDC